MVLSGRELSRQTDSPGKGPEVGAWVCSSNGGQGGTDGVGEGGVRSDRDTAGQILKGLKPQ